MKWLNRRFFFTTLRGRLMLSVAILHAIMMTTFIIDLTFRQKEMLLDRQEEMAIAYCQTLSTNASEWLASNDVSGLQELIESQRHNSEIIYAMLVDHSGLILAHTSKTRIGEYSADLPRIVQQTIISKSPELIDIAVPVMLAGRHLGWARIGLGQKMAKEKLNEITNSGLLYVVVTIIIGAFVAWVMGRNLSNRLYVIQRTVKKIAAGDSAARTHLKGSDEASVLAKEFNIMLDTLERTEKQRKESEEALREREAMLKTVFDNSPVGIEIYDKSGFLKKANKKVDEIFGTNSEKLIDKYNLLKDPKYQYGDMLDRLKNGAEVTHEVEIDFNTVQYETTKKESVYLNIIITPISELLSKNIGYIIQVTDVTDKKLTDQKIMKAVIQTQENERHEIGSELHDNVCQILVATLMNIGVLRKSLPPSSAPILDQTKQFVNMAFEDIRNISHRVAPVFFTDTKLEDAFSRLLSTFKFGENVKVLLHIGVDDGKYHLSPELKLNLYRILQEQLSNIQKHAKAKNISIDVIIDLATLKMLVIDDGIGFDVDRIAEGIGIANMRRRTELFSGKFEIVSSPGNGCVLKVEFPVEKQSKAG